MDSRNNRARSLPETEVMADTIPLRIVSYVAVGRFYAFRV
jgi:hypothetical protein